MSNLYTVLGLDERQKPSESEIRRAYRRIALTAHPDKNPDDPDAARKFDAIRRAYETLTSGKKIPTLLDPREQLRRELERKERGSAPARSEICRRRNRDAMDALTRKWERSEIPKIPKLDDIDACIAFSRKLTPKLQAELVRKTRQQVEEMLSRIEVHTID
jgi:curved DNA-binding protein CbpA